MFLSAFLFFVVMGLMPSKINASEGIADLRSNGSGGACFAASVFIDNVYKIMATCRDLKIALTPEKNRYVLWMSDEGERVRRLGEVINGKFYGQVDQKFSKLFVTVERDGYVTKPSEDVLLIGQVRDIDFGAGVSPAESLITPTPTQKKAVITPKDEQVEEAEQGGLGSTLGAVFKIVLLGFGALLLIVGVFSFLSRRRSL